LAKEIEHVMAATQNHQVRLAARPVGLPKRSDWQFTEAPVPEPRDGEVLAKVLYLSLDPAMRGWMSEGKSYIAPIGIGEVMRAGGVGRVQRREFRQTGASSRGALRPAAPSRRPLHVVR